MLTDAKKKVLSDLAIGKNVTSAISADDQFSALRKQMDLVLKANPKVEIDADYKALSELVEKEKKEKKTTMKTKK